MTKPQNVFLIGPMGAGKSAVGRQLGRMLHLDFMDSDDEIEARTGVDIPFIFEKEGEEGFRKREVSAIDDLTAKDVQSMYDSFFPPSSAGSAGKARPSSRSRFSASGSKWKIGAKCMYEEGSVKISRVNADATYDAVLIVEEQRWYWSVDSGLLKKHGKACGL